MAPPGGLERTAEEPEDALSGTLIGGLGLFGNEDELENARDLLRRTATLFDPDAVSEFGVRANGAHESLQERGRKMMEDLGQKRHEMEVAGARARAQTLH